MFPDADNNWGLSHSGRRAFSGQVKYLADEVIHFSGRGLGGKLGGKALAAQSMTVLLLRPGAWAVARRAFCSAHTARREAGCSGRALAVRLAEAAVAAPGAEAIAANVCAASVRC